MTVNVKMIDKPFYGLYTVCERAFNMLYGSFPTERERTEIVLQYSKCRDLRD